MTILVCLVSGIGYWSYLKDNSNRVVHGIDFNHNTFQSENFNIRTLLMKSEKLFLKKNSKNGIHGKK
jgi:hypothetical protein